MSEPQSVHCLHILIKCNTSRRPASWRDPHGTRILATTQMQAIQQILQIRTDIEEGKVKFNEVAEKVSDCSSAANGGDLGSFPRGAMQKAFEDVAFSLKPGEISKPVITDSGVHIILRIE